MKYKKYLFGRKYLRKSLKQRTQYLEKLNIFMFIGTIAIFSMCSLLIFLTIVNHYNFKVETKIDLSNLTIEERNKVQPILDDIKYSYLNTIKEIRFVHEITEIEIEGKELLGYNKRNGYITILYDRNIHQMRETISHEILHNYIKNDEYSHKIVYDLEKYLPVYKSSDEYLFECVQEALYGR